MRLHRNFDCIANAVSSEIATAAFATFRHKEDDRACDAASRDNSDVKYVTRLTVGYA